MSQPIYKRILLKLSGEALQGDEGFGIDPSILDRMALEIKELIEMGVEVGVVLGGGNLFRGAKLAKAGMNRVVGDHMGTYNWSEAIKMLREKRVVIFSAGTGSPFFTTDSAACLRGIEIEADIVLKATKVDGVYDCDPAKNPNAKLYHKLSYAEVIDKELKVMDLAAFTLARDHGMPIRVFNMCKPGALRKVVLGTEEGTTIS